MRNLSSKAPHTAVAFPQRDTPVTRDASASRPNSLSSPARTASISSMLPMPRPSALPSVPHAFPRRDTDHKKAPLCSVLSDAIAPFSMTMRAYPAERAHPEDNRGCMHTMKGFPDGYFSPEDLSGRYTWTVKCAFLPFAVIFIRTSSPPMTSKGFLTEDGSLSSVPRRS